MVVGLTGGIGTGKSTVSRILREKGFAVIDLDVISRDIIKCAEIKKKLVKAFGTGIIENRIQNKFIPADSDYGNIEISRKKLGRTVFGNRDKLDKLNSIMHPAILDEMRRQIDTAKKNNRIVVVEIQLLFEVQWENEFDVIVLVYADRETQIRRILERDGRTEEEALSIINSQMDMEEKRKRSHYVINNSGSLESLKDEVENIFELMEMK